MDNNNNCNWECVEERDGICMHNDCHISECDCQKCDVFFSCINCKNRQEDCGEINFSSECLDKERIELNESI